MVSLGLIKEELTHYLRIALPSLLRFYLLAAADRITIGFVGRFDDNTDHFSAVVLGKVYSNVTGLSVGIGIALGLNTFCSQNHGRGESHANGQILRQGAKVLLVAFLFSLAAACFSMEFLRACGQPPELLPYVWQLTMIQALGLPAAWFGNCVNNILVSQGIVMPGVVTDSIGSSLNLILAFVFLRSGMGFSGIAWAVVAANFTSGFSSILYVVIWRKQAVVWRWTGEPVSSDVTLRRYCETAFPSALSMWAEWWGAEVLTILAGLLPGDPAYRVAVVGGHGILMNSLVVFYMAFVCMQVASTTRVGNLVGAKQADRIPLSICSGVAFTVLVALATSVVLHFAMPGIIDLFTTDDDIRRVANSAILGVVLSVPPYSIMMFLLGVMRGADLQVWGAFAVGVSFFALGLPTGAFLGLKLEMGLMGVWVGNVISLSCSALLMGVRLFLVDWHSIVATAAPGLEPDPLSVSLARVTPMNNGRVESQTE